MTYAQFSTFVSSLHRNEISLIAKMIDELKIRQKNLSKEQKEADKIVSKCEKLQVGWLDDYLVQSQRSIQGLSLEELNQAFTDLKSHISETKKAEKEVEKTKKKEEVALKKNIEILKELSPETEIPENSTSTSVKELIQGIKTQHSEEKKKRTQEAKAKLVEADNILKYRNQLIESTHEYAIELLNDLDEDSTSEDYKNANKALREKIATEKKEEKDCSQIKEQIQKRIDANQDFFEDGSLDEDNYDTEDLNSIELRDLRKTLEEDIRVLKKERLENEKEIARQLRAENSAKKKTEMEAKKAELKRKKEAGELEPKNKYFQRFTRYHTKNTDKSEWEEMGKKAWNKLQWDALSQAEREDPTAVWNTEVEAEE
tara:strand:+ start:155 stop:1270 length:1116 start_codon:yes stop_codon:yes gene_type:complete